MLVEILQYDILAIVKKTAKNTVNLTNVIFKFNFMVCLSSREGKNFS